MGRMRSTMPPAPTLAVPVPPRARPKRSSPPVPPQEAEHYFAIDALLSSIESGAIGALRGSYLESLALSHKRISRRQELPDDAFWTADELRKLHTGLVDKCGASEALWRFCRLFVALS
jgi:hypothetical protein